jgi:hypothetical protein
LVAPVVSPADLSAAPLPPCTALALPSAPGASLAELVDAYGPPASVAFYLTVNGDPVLRAGWDRIPDPSDMVEVVVLPSGGGDNTKSIIAIAAMIALAAFAPWAGGLIAGALASGSALVAGLASTAILAGGGILINTLLAPTPAAQAAASLQASPTYSTSASGNQARLMEIIPAPYGNFRIVPDFVSDPYQEFNDNDQYLYLLLGRGLGKSEPESVQIGETVIWSASGGYTGAIDDVDLTFYDPGEQIDAFPVQVESSSEVGGQLLDQGAVIGPFTAVPSGETAHELAVDIVLPEGLYRLSDSGAQQAATVQFKFEYREIDDLGAPIGSWQILANETLTLTTPTPQRRTYRATVPAGRYEVRAERLNPWADDDRIFDRLQWNGLRAYLDGPQSFPDISTLAVRIRANEQITSEASRQFKVVQTRILPVWNGSAWVDQPTRSIAWAAVDICRNTVYGAGLSDTRVDLAAFLAYEALWDARGDTFDGVFDTRTTRFAAINEVLAAGRASVAFLGDQVSLVRDEPRTLPVQVFTDRNILRGSLEIDYDLHKTDSADDVIVEYTDRTTWKTEEVRCTIAESTSQQPARVRMKGPTDRDHAWREGIHLAADNFFRRQKLTFRTELEGRLLKRGDLVRVQSHIPQTWGHAGVVLAISGLDLELDGEPETDPANTYIRFRQKNGSEWGPVKITWTPGSSTVTMNTADYNAVTASLGSLGPHLDDDGGEAPTYLLGEGVDFAFTGIVTAMVPEGRTCRVQVVKESAAVHTADQGLTTPAVPPGTLLPPSSGAPDVGTFAAVRDISVTESFLTVSAAAVSGATSYQVEVSYDNLSWIPVYDGQAPVTQATVRRDALWVRMRAVGDLPGPWRINAIAAAPEEVRLPDGTVVPTAAAVVGAVSGTIPADQLVDNISHATDLALLTRDSLINPAAAAAAGNSVLDVLRIAGETQLLNILEEERNRAAIAGTYAAIQRVETVFTQQNLAFAEQITTLTASVGDNTSQIISVDQARADGDAALATSIDALSVTVGENASAIIAEASARVDADSALSTSLTSVSTTVSGHTASINVLQTSVDGLEANYVLAVQAGGVTGGFTVTGIEQADGSGVINFGITANSFYIVDPTDLNNAVLPFVVTNGTVYMNELVVVSVTADTLSAISAVLGDIVGGRFQSTNGKLDIRGDDVDTYIRMTA